MDETMPRADAVLCCLLISLDWRVSFAFVATRRLFSVSPPEFRRIIGMGKDGRYRPSCIITSPVIQCTVKKKGQKDESSESDIRNDTKAALQLLMNLAMSHVVSQALRTVTQLQIPDMLQEGPLTVDDIVAIHQDRGQDESFRPNRNALLKLMRVLAAAGIFSEKASFSTTTRTVSQPTFRLTTAGSLLQQDHEHKHSGASSMILHLLEEPLWNAWAQVPNYVAGCSSAAGLPFDTANGNQSASHYYSTHVESLEHANHFVKWIASLEIEACVQGFDWSILSNRTVVDLGGHYGEVMEAVKMEYPTVACVCLDLPRVTQDCAKASSGSSCSSSTVRYVEGDMFDPATIPSCDAIFMKHIVLCDWEESDSKRILESCRRVLPRDGIVIIGEAVLPDAGEAANGGQLPLLADALMMVVGREGARTVAEWDEFARSCGFRVDSVAPTSVPTCSIIVLRVVKD